jgi:hypothetical protein
MASSVFNIPEQPLLSFVIDFYKTSSLMSVFGLVMGFLIQGGTNIVTLIFIVNSNNLYVGLGWNLIILSILIAPWAPISYVHPFGYIFKAQLAKTTLFYALFI